MLTAALFLSCHRKHQNRSSSAQRSLSRTTLVRAASPQAGGNVSKPRDISVQSQWYALVCLQPCHTDMHSHSFFAVCSPERNTDQSLPRGESTCLPLRRYCLPLWRGMMMLLCKLMMRQRAKGTVKELAVVMGTSRRRVQATACTAMEMVDKIQEIMARGMSWK